VQRTTSDIPAEALEDTTRLTSENITYLKNILTQKLSKNVVEVKARGGDEVTVVFSDNKSRVVRLANENTPKSVVSDSNSPIKTSIPVTAGYDVRSAGGLSGATTSYSTSPDRFTAEIPKAKLLRTVSATVNPLYSHIHDNSLRPVCLTMRRLWCVIGLIRCKQNGCKKSKMVGVKKSKIFGLKKLV